MDKEVKLILPRAKHLNNFWLISTAMATYRGHRGSTEGHSQRAYLRQQIHSSCAASHPESLLREAQRRNMTVVPEHA